MKKSTATVVKQDSNPVRAPLPAAVLHQVNLRDQGRCTHVTNGKRCNQARWTEIHHKIPVSQGGPNTPENLITLCSTHHQLQHLEKDFRPARFVVRDEAYGSTTPYS
ncbi:MAG: HNH endonuclease signature motif containing protein [Oligoflexia bacterium]|nr:HNH endonuclease signature motif containing protein [Oligoflexia bacterium]